MININWVTIIAVLIVGSVKTLFAQYTTDDKRAEFYLAVSKKYAPAAYEILKSDEKQSFLTYADNEETARGLLSKFNTVVHETCHGYNFRIGLKAAWGSDGYFITPGITIATHRGNYFSSTMLNKVVPKEQQEKIFRYETYVSGASNNSATTQGVYGFVDEFTSYYHGTRIDYEMLPFFETLCPYSDAKCWVQEYLSSMQSTLYAYYEFRLFIAWYLIYAEKNEQKVFNELMANQNLRVAFTLVDDLYKKLIDDYFSVRSKLIAKLTAAGTEIELTDEYLYIVTRSSNSSSKSGTGIPDDDITYLKSLYTIKENNMIERFRVIGVSLVNYQRFLQHGK
jgi:hypothetical protein